jgi:voltage-gated potassium channel
MDKALNIINLKLIYKKIIAYLILAIIILMSLDLTEEIQIESTKVLSFGYKSILLVFAFDYLLRLFISKNRWKYFKENILDLIAIFPFYTIFSMVSFARYTKILRLGKTIKLLKIFTFVKLIAFIKKFNDKINTFIYSSGFLSILYLTISVLVLGAIGIYITEKGQTVNSFGDALWWSFVTSTTVGYGDISPSTGFGRIIAAILMLSGIGFIGLLTGSIATYFMRKPEKKKRVYEDRNALDLSDLNDEQYLQVLSFVDFVRMKGK